MSVPSRPFIPWTRYEKLELLTEILKAFEVAPEELLPLILKLGEPPWDHMYIPRGRSLAQCRAMYQEYVMRATPRVMPSRPGGIYGPHGPHDSVPAPQMYTPESLQPTQSINSRYPEIQPRPPNYTGPSGMAMSPSSEPPRKKRGRPTKAESELRKEAAKARGESVSEVRRDTVHAGSSHGQVSVAAQAAQAVMAPAQTSGRPATTPEVLPTTRKRPLSREEAESARHASATTDDDPGALSQLPQQSMSRASIRDYPQILSQDSTGGTSGFRAPRGGA